eukprot:gnl/MRDRNA2_/MRDRNA2_109870_c0_seq1.p1 gnl/MRDRNA2_/MRDRNA2_109870_c0~~gnl/MRDRNA2_/MRDRNA2_109870_c0_seq1.p1  ORF type:complete len:597 (-),score=115.48 gnl/MRDRNA2_/MRDRNA2_109870_c0_seq1:12-1802(-)
MSGYERAKHNICFDYMKGSCTRGDRCRFEHGAPADEAAGNQATSDNWSHGYSGGPYGQVRRQVEYYLSDANLQNDKFFLDKIKEDPEGWLDMDVILSCQRMMRMKATQEIVFEALKDSKLEVRGNETGPAAVRRPPHWSLPVFRQDTEEGDVPDVPSGPEKRMIKSEMEKRKDYTVYTYEEVCEMYAHMEFSAEDMKKFWEEDMVPEEKKVVACIPGKSSRSPAVDEGDLPGRLVNFSRILGRILRHQADELGLTVNSDGYIPLGEIMQLSDRFPGQFDGLKNHTVSDVEIIVETSLSDGYPRFEMKSVSGAKYVRARHNTTLSSVNPDHLPVPPPNHKSRKALTDGTTAGGSAARRTAERKHTSKAQDSDKCKVEDANASAGREAIQLGRIDGPDPWKNKDPWSRKQEEYNDYNAQQVKATDQVAGYSTCSLPTASSNASVLTVKDKRSVQNACKKACDGYLGLAVGDLVEVLYIGTEGKGDAGWIFGTKLATSEQGWLPQSSLGTSPEPKQEFGAGPPQTSHVEAASLVKGGEAKVIRGVHADPTQGYLAVKEGALLKVQYIGSKPEDTGWVYGYEIGKKEVAGWIKSEVLEAC